MTSVSVSELSEYPSLDTLDAKDIEFSIMPLWTIVIFPSSLLCGWALESVTPPCVAHLVCPIEIIAPSNLPFALITKSETYPVVLSVSILSTSSVRIAASPAESYPLYSSFLRPSRTCPAASSAMQPYMPHIFNRVNT